MAVYRFQCAWQVDSANPTDQLIITPHFKDVNLGPFDADDALGLCTDLANGLDTWATLHTKLTVTCYQADHAPPNFPIASFVKNPTLLASAPANRDLALCLSYFATDNRPRKRGRLYIPCCVCSINGNANNATPANMTKVAALVPVFTGLGGVDVDWVVWSRADNTSRPVTDWFIDNAWDTQRRRGAIATARQTGTTTEGAAPNMVPLVNGWQVAAASADQTVA
jgi:hypothetical protein